MIDLSIYHHFYYSSFYDLTPIDKLFPDEDFCLYLDFPVQRMVFLIVSIDATDVFDMNHVSCTFLWLIRYINHINNAFKVANLSISVLPFSLFFQKFNLTEFYKALSECDFDKRVNHCMISNTSIYSSEPSIKDFAEHMTLWHFSSIITSPLICLIGLVSNLIVVYVIAKNQKALKEKQYTYMMLRSIVNSIILLIQSFSILNQCQFQNGLFCSSIHRMLVVQYFKIIFVEFFGNYFRLVANLFYIAFSFNRLSLVGKNHDKLTQFLADLKVLYFVIFSFIIGFVISFVKVFRFI